jgi:hypothetical protein
MLLAELDIVAPRDANLESRNHDERLVRYTIPLLEGG